MYSFKLALFPEHHGKEPASNLNLSISIRRKGTARGLKLWLESSTKWPTMVSITVGAHYIIMLMTKTEPIWSSQSCRLSTEATTFPQVTQSTPTGGLHPALLSYRFLNSWKHAVMAIQWQAEMYMYCPMEYCSVAVQPGTTSQTGNHCWITPKCPLPTFSQPTRIPTLRSNKQETFHQTGLDYSMRVPQSWFLKLHLSRCATVQFVCKPGALSPAASHSRSSDVIQPVYW